ncbi:TolC family protein [Pararhodonellum marinum]|uniref:TolC family protein n=1 Tax=Pararhodonellum marinum TaxID=2755358 RepID=UPI0018907A67|nr:TolC family protein [Pararhodonellum marinum]
MNSIKKAIFTTLFLMGLGIGNAFSQEVIYVTLDESIKYALENNVDAKNAQLEILASKGIINENLATGLPQINGILEWTKNLQPPFFIIPAEAGENLPGGGGDGPPPGTNLGDVQLIPFAVNYQGTAGINLEQMIFNGSYFVGLRAAKTLKSLTEFDKEKTENDVIESVKKAYFTVLVNKERKTLATANLERIDVLLRETEALFEAGFAEKLEVSRVKVQRNNIKAELDRIEAASEVSMELLKLQMGMPLNYRLVATEKLADLNTDEELEQLLQNPGYRRVEMDQLTTNLKLATLDLKNNQVQYIPTINAVASYQRLTGSQRFGDFFSADRWFSTSFVGVRMAIPIFDGLTKSSRIQQNRVQIQQLENQKVFLQDNIESEIFQAKTNLRNNLSALRVQQENRELALEVFQMTQIKYSEGVGSNLEVVEADTALKEAEINFFSALYDALIAKVDLEKALGIL